MQLSTLPYAERTDTQILDSAKAILDLAPILQELARRCGQPGVMHWLSYYLERAALSKRTPVLVLVLRQGCGDSLRAEALEGAVLLFEYRVLGLRTGAIASADSVGFTSVVAPEPERARIACLAVNALLERGAAVVMASYGGRAIAQDQMFGTRAAVLSTVRERPIQQAMALQTTLEETLAQLGKSTRFNLRYYRKRLEKELGCVYLPDAAKALEGVDLLSLNAGSLNPVSPEEFALRVRSASETPGSFLAGLRGKDGGWLSLIGGWRDSGRTVLYWQMNAAGWEKHSVGTAMRSYFLEDEVARGTRELVIHGGTPHSMRHAFREETLADIVVRRRNLQGMLLQWVSRFLVGDAGVLGNGNFLASTLQDQRLVWTPRVSARAIAPTSGTPIGAGPKHPAHLPERS